MTSSTKPARLCTTAVAARDASVSVFTIRRWVKQGQLTDYRINRTLRIDLDELDALVQKGGRS